MVLKWICYPLPLQLYCLLMDQIQLVVNAFTVSMTDAERMAVINAAADAVETNYRDLTTFNKENQLLSLQRAKDAQEIQMVKALYGF